MSQPKLYTDKIAGSISACMGFVRDGGEGRFVPNTVLEGDIRSKLKSADRIVATYRKKHDEKQYSEIVFTAKKVEWEKLILPEEYSYLVLPEMHEKIRDGMATPLSDCVDETAVEW